MPGGVSRKRQGKTITLLGLDKTIDEFKALPVKLRRHVAAAINEQIGLTQTDLVNRIAADGVQKSAVKSRILLNKATADKNEATIKLDRKRVPFSKVKFAIKTEDSTGSRASVWVSFGGKRVRVFGFVNPYGRTKKPLIRNQKGKTSRLVRAGGVGLRAYWNVIIDEHYVSGIKTELGLRVMNRLGGA